MLTFWGYLSDVKRRAAQRPLDYDLGVLRRSMLRQVSSGKGFMSACRSARHQKPIQRLVEFRPTIDPIMQAENRTISLFGCTERQL
jgi:hypothetical protein